MTARRPAGHPRARGAGRDGAGRTCCRCWARARRSATSAARSSTRSTCPRASCRRRRRSAASAATRVLGHDHRAGAGGLGAALPRPPARRSASGALTIRPPWLDGAPERPRDRPRHDVRRRHARVDAAEPGAAAAARARRRAVRLGRRQRRAGDRGGAARLGAGDRARARPARGRGDRGQRARQRRRASRCARRSTCCATSCRGRRPCSRTSRRRCTASIAARAGAPARAARSPSGHAGALRRTTSPPLYAPLREVDRARRGRVGGGDRSR